MKKLPWDIVYQIICEAILRNEAIKRRIPSYNSLADILTLLKVNRSWRSAALAFMLRTYSIVFPQHNGYMSTKFKYWPSYMGKAEKYGYGYIKDIIIDAKLAAIASGHILEKLKTIDVFNHNTTGINSLTLIISGPIENYWVNAGDYKHHLDAFFEFIGSYKSLSIVCNHISFGKVAGINDVLFSNILQVARKASYAKLSIHGLDIPHNFNTFLNLSVLDIMWNESYEATTSFIHQCATQLTRLHILYKVFNGMDALVQGSVRYPSLKELILTTNLYDSPIMKFYSEGVFFPHLQHLELNINYPFADDTLFRSNSIQYLQLVNHSETLDKIKEFFRYTKLHYLVIKPPRSGPFSNNAPIQIVYPCKFVTIFRPTLKYLELRHYSRERINIPNCHFPEYLKILNIPKIYLATSNIITLLKNLQSLSHLCCSFDTSVQVNYTSNELEELKSSLYPLSTVFWNWKVDKNPVSDISAISKAIVALAILCPSLSHVEACTRYTENLNLEIFKQARIMKLERYIGQIYRQFQKSVKGEIMDANELESDNGSNPESMSGCESVTDFSLFA